MDHVGFVGLRGRSGRSPATSLGTSKLMVFDVFFSKWIHWTDALGAHPTSQVLRPLLYEVFNMMFQVWEMTMGQTG